MRLKTQAQSRRRGIATLELALALPVLSGVVLGIWEVGRMAEVKQVITAAAAEGGRQAASGEITNAAVQQAVLQYLQVALNDNDSSGNTGRNRSARAVIQVSDLTSPGTDVSAASYLDQIQVSVSIPFDDVGWTSVDYVTNSSTAVSAQVVIYSLKDQSYPTSPPTPPLE